MKFCIDENMPKGFSKALSQAGYEACEKAKGIETMAGNLLHPRREAQLSPDGVQRIHKASLVMGCLVLSWSGSESGIHAFTEEETHNLLTFLEQWQGEISIGKNPIL